tara:strand:- start:2627 stop:2731 length:105 start_codon:yes stop_codon:yes gene_type:complete
VIAPNAIAAIVQQTTALVTNANAKNVIVVKPHKG